MSCLFIVDDNVKNVLLRDSLWDWLFASHFLRTNYQLSAPDLMCIVALSVPRFPWILVPWFPWVAVPCFLWIAMKNAPAIS